MVLRDNPDLLLGDDIGDLGLLSSDPVVVLLASRRSGRRVDVDRLREPSFFVVERRPGAVAEEGWGHGSGMDSGSYMLLLLLNDDDGGSGCFSFSVLVAFPGLVRFAACLGDVPSLVSLY